VSAYSSATGLRSNQSTTGFAEINFDLGDSEVDAPVPASIFKTTEKTGELCR